MKLLFPYSNVRKYQKDFIKSLYLNLNNNYNTIVHAPTGLGKTVSALSPILTKFLDTDKKILFLTPKLTQHDIVLKTIKSIESKFNMKIPTADLVGKSSFCPYVLVNDKKTSDVYNLCSNLRKNKKCNFYNNTKENYKFTDTASNALDEILKNNISSDKLLSYSCTNNFCAYELSLEIAKKAKVIIADYYYIFNPSIRQQFLEKMELELSDIILVVDEAHNLPERIRNILSSTMSNSKLDLISKELLELHYSGLASQVNQLKDMFDPFEMLLLKEKKKQKDEYLNEIIFDRNSLINEIERILRGFSIDGIDDFLFDLKEKEEEILIKNESSQLTSLISFLDLLKNLYGIEENKFVFFFSENISKSNIRYDFNISSLDPSIITSNIFDKIYNSTLMSATLAPLEMYRDILGLKKCKLLKYESPFEEKNRLDLIVPITSTQYTRRNDNEFIQTGKILSEICDEIKGNVAVFFPSYELLESISQYIDSYKKQLKENKEMNKDDKQNMINLFIENKNKGAILLAVANGNFSEGIDLPGDHLNGVIVVGLPLQRPNLEIKKLIDYYDEKFKKGWDYAYINPAFSKIIQSAGRCIRSQRDKGVIVYLDERYMTTKYRLKLSRKNIKISKNYTKDIREFYESHNNI
ncbi:MAG: ATP-dependent DNA helicase [Candidatus Nanoarchaeia archaeon]|nr:ATP-dependent DNA helicase [Candidatus Nanoarchaeia archaeon]